MHPCLTLQLNPTWCTILLNVFISLLYMFRASIARHQEKIAVSMRHWYLSLYGWRLVCWLESNQQTRRHDLSCLRPCIILSDPKDNCQILYRTIYTNHLAKLMSSNKSRFRQQKTTDFSACRKKTIYCWRHKR